MSTPAPALPKIAVIGSGHWGKNHVRNFHALGALCCICDANTETLQKAAELAPGIPTSIDYDALIGDDSVDAVVLATPAETHVPMATKALEAGKHVFVEKPLALDAEGADDLTKLAAEKGLILMVGHLLEYHPAMVKLRELVKSGALGDIQYIYSNRLNFGKIRTHENALWSFAPHDVAAILGFVKALPENVTCTGGSYITPNLADVTVSTLNFENGIRAHIFVSWLNPFKEQKFVIMGSKQMAVFNDVEPEHKLQLFPHEVAISGEVPTALKAEAVNVELPKLEPLREECQHFINCIQNNTQPRTDGENGTNVIRVLHACQSSLEQGGTPVKLS